MVVPRGAVMAALLLLLGASMGHVHSDYEQSDPLMDAAELESLFQVMEALSDIEWRKRYPHPCSATPWPGIHCEERADDGLSHVTRIDFGSLPNSTCRKGATISPAILGLHSLRSLFVLDCFLDGNASIPRGISSLAPSLKTLSLRGNPGLTGEIPAEIGRLSALEVLSLSQNGLRGRLPRELGSLARLQSLDLSYNSFSGPIPAELGSLASLTILDLNANRLSQSIPPQLGRLPLLQKLDLGGNLLSGPIPSSLGTMQSLKFLALAGNALTGGVPASFSKLGSLEYLILDGNSMQGALLPDFWSGLGNLSELSLAACGFLGPIPASIGELPYLSELSLEDNQLNGSIPESLGRLPNIYHLNLSGNMLSGPVPFGRDILYRLGENLDLRGNLDLCLNVPVPKNVSTKNLSPCGAAISQARSHRPLHAVLLLLLLLLALSS